MIIHLYCYEHCNSHVYAIYLACDEPSLLEDTKQPQLSIISIRDEQEKHERSTQGAFESVDELEVGKSRDVSKAINLENEQTNGTPAEKCTKSVSFPPPKSGVSNDTNFKNNLNSDGYTTPLCTEKCCSKSISKLTTGDIGENDHSCSDDCDQMLQVLSSILNAKNPTKNKVELGRNILNCLSDVLLSKPCVSTSERFSSFEAQNNNCDRVEFNRHYSFDAKDRPVNDGGPLDLSNKNNTCINKWYSVSNPNLLTCGENVRGECKQKNKFINVEFSDQLLLINNNKLKPTKVGKLGVGKQAPLKAIVTDVVCCKGKLKHWNNFQQKLIFLYSVYEFRPKLQGEK